MTRRTDWKGQPWCQVCAASGRRTCEAGALCLLGAQDVHIPMSAEGTNRHAPSGPGQCRGFLFLIGPRGSRVSRLSHFTVMRDEEATILGKLLHIGIIVVIRQGVL